MSCINSSVDCYSLLYLKKGTEKGKGQCHWTWILQCRGFLSLSRPTFTMQSSPSPSKSGVSLSPPLLCPTHPPHLMLGSQTLCPHCHHLRDVPLWAGCSPIIHPLGHPYLLPLISPPLQILYMTPASSSHILVSASLIWACWDVAPLERSTRWARQEFHNVFVIQFIH